MDIREADPGDVRTDAEGQSGLLSQLPPRRTLSSDFGRGSISSTVDVH